MISSVTSFPPLDFERLRGPGHYIPRSAVPPGRDHVLGVKLSEDVATLALIFRRNVDGIEYIDARAVEREPFATYPALVTRLETILHGIRARTEIVIALGPGGAAAFNTFERLEPFGLVLTNSIDGEQRDGRLARIGGRELVSRMHALAHEGRLRVSPDLPLAAALAGELRSAEFDDAARYDFTVALAAACWRVRATPALCVHYARASGQLRAPQPAPEPLRLFRLRRPPGSAVNIVQTRGGGSIAADESGCIELPADDAEPLLRQGWTYEPEPQGAQSR